MFLGGTAIDNPLAGNVAHGERSSWGKSQYGSCHMVRGKGALNVRRLAKVAAEFKLSLITEALTDVDHRVYDDCGAHLRPLPAMDTYDTGDVALSTRRTVDDLLLNHDSYFLPLICDDNQLDPLDRSQVKAITNKRPLMQTDKLPTNEEVADLMPILTRQWRKALAVALATVSADPD